MKPVHVCIVVFNRYDLLAKLFQSIKASTLQPAAVYVIDRGGQPLKAIEAADGLPITIVPFGGQSLAAAWNWFIVHVPEERVIASDDIEFFPETLETMVTTPGGVVGIDDPGRSSAFACFLIRDACVERVGLFDEAIAPDYLYFEDCDYGRRLELAGIPIVGVRCFHHGASQSLSAKTPAQVKEHHRRFTIAHANYVRKWGGEPGREHFVSPKAKDARL